MKSNVFNGNPAPNRVAQTIVYLIKWHNRLHGWWCSPAGPLSPA